MLSLRRLPRTLIAGIRYHWRSLLTFHLFFFFLSLALLAPFSAWLLSALVRLSGETLVSNDDLVHFILSLPGLIWLLLSGTLLALLLFIEHAGLMYVCTRNQQRRFHTAMGALWQVVRRLPTLLRLAGWQVLLHGLILLPVLVLLAFSFQQLLGDYDIYYVLQAWPTPARWFLLITGVAGLFVLGVNGQLYVRWLLALPALLQENLTPWQALRRSSQLTAGKRLKMATLVLSAAALVAFLPLMISVLFNGLGWLSFRVLPEQYHVVIGAMVLLLFGYAIVQVLAGFVSVSVNSLLALKIYYRNCGYPSGVTTEPEPRNTAWYAGLVELVVVALAIGQAGYALKPYGPQAEVLNIAHRGASLAAPENSLPAIRKAIAAGADYVEVDVRLTRDQQPVLMHDRDLRRLAGDPRPVWDIPLAELQQLDAGSWFSAEYAGEPVPTLAEAIEVIGEQARLYLEFKGQARSPALIPTTMQVLADAEYLDHTTVASLAPADLVQVQQTYPKVRRSLLVHTALGELAEQPVDVLALRDALVSPQMLAWAQRQEMAVHVWTVNDPVAMARFIDLGVAGIITDDPALLSEVIEQRLNLSRAERWLLRLRHWVW